MKRRSFLTALLAVFAAPKVAAASLADTTPNYGEIESFLEEVWEQIKPSPEEIYSWRDAHDGFAVDSEELRAQAGLTSEELESVGRYALRAYLDNKTLR